MKICTRRKQPRPREFSVKLLLRASCRRDALIFPVAEANALTALFRIASRIPTLLSKDSTEPASQRAPGAWVSYKGKVVVPAGSHLGLDQLRPGPELTCGQLR